MSSHDSAGSPVVSSRQRRLASREETVPDWLAERLVDTAGVPPVEVAAMDARTAFDAWNAYIARPAEDS